jgi:hypothetical protein
MKQFIFFIGIFFPFSNKTSIIKTLTIQKSSNEPKKIALLVLISRNGNDIDLTMLECL